MKYQDRINQSQQKGYQRTIATKIIDSMDKLRKSNNENNYKRWIWELLQNAKDVKNREHKGVDIIVDLNTSEKVLVFKHNGKHFSTDNITFLIEQVSTKERSVQNSEETTGKFGTGFLTTHLLSEIVEVEGVVKDDDDPYRKFCITLDRSSREIPATIDSIKRSMEQLSLLDQAEDYDDYDTKKFNTSFTYHLDDYGLKTARTGIEDLEISLPLTLVFVPSILSVEIKGHSNIYYTISKNEEITLKTENLTLQICTIKKYNSQENIICEIKFLLLKGHDCEIAIPINEDDTLFSIADLQKGILSRLFCDFPLIGSEEFGTPFFINSSYFYPTEPRDGVFLTEINREDKEISRNKEIVKKSVSNYLDLIDYVSSQDWGCLYQLASISIPPKSEWLSINWYKENVQEPIQNKIYLTPLVRKEDGSKIPLKDEEDRIVNIPFDDREEVREAIWDLVSGIGFFLLPSKVESHKWYQIFKSNIWDEEHRLTVSRLTEYMVNGNKTLNDLSTAFGINAPINWLNRYFSVLRQCEKDPIKFLQDGKYAIIPNQYGELCLPNELMNDKGIEDALKDVGKELFKDYYSFLADSAVSIKDLLRTKTQESVIGEINEALKLPKVSLEKRSLACHNLTRLFPTVEAQVTETKALVYDISKKLFDGKSLEKIFISKWMPEICVVSEQMQIELIVQTISSHKNLLDLSKFLSEEIDIVREWLSNFVSLLFRIEKQDLVGKRTPIVPNQNGAFCDVNSLFGEGELIDESLKDISLSLSRDYRDELIDTMFDVQIHSTRHIFQRDIGQKIQELVRHHLSELQRSNKTQSIFDELILWMDANPKIANDIFGYLFENRHKLYDDAEVAKNLRQVRQLEMQVASLSIENQDLKNENNQLKTDLENLREQINLSEQINQNSSELDVINQKEIDNDFLITYGVTTEQQLMQILRDPRISSRYRLSSSSDYLSKLQYVLQIIERAKQNVRKYLESLKEYDCSGWYEAGTTHITGIKKYETQIEIIVRPSDNQKIIFHYPIEKEALALSDSELWVEDGKYVPRQITLGDVLTVLNVDTIDLPQNF